MEREKDGGGGTRGHRPGIRKLLKYSDITDRQTAGEQHNGGSKECSGPSTRGGLTQRPRETRESVFLVKKEVVLRSGGY